MADLEKQDKQLYENMSYSLRAPRYAVNIFKEIAEEFTSPGAAFERLVNEHAEGIKPQVEANRQAVDGLKEANRKIEELEQSVENYKRQLSDSESEKEEMRLRIGELQQQLDDNGIERDRLTEELQSRKAAAEDHILVPISPLERKCLEYMAERERKDRKRDDITPEVFFMYCVREMLIKGNKFSIKCVPDSVIAKFEKELKNGGGDE